MKYQITLYAADGKYKPVSCIIETKETEKAKIKTLGIIKICQKRLWNKSHLKQYGYTQIKMREVE